MDKELAKRLIDEIVKCSLALGELEAVVGEIPDTVQRDEREKQSRTR